jgi:hypothetical protein
MSNVFQFPMGKDRDWRNFESSLREALRGNLHESLLDTTLPAIREHWTSLCEGRPEVSVTLPPMPPLTHEQHRAVQASLDAVATAYSHAVQVERCEAVARLAMLELELTSERKRQGR